MNTQHSHHQQYREAYGVGVGTVRNQERCAAIRLYDEVWSKVGEQFYLLGRLNNWGWWRHRFDDVIFTMEDAVRRSNEMLGALGDRYTKVYFDGKSNHFTVDEDLMPVEACIFEPDCGYLGIGTFNLRKVAEHARAKLDEIGACRKLVLDQRGNLGGWTNEAIAAATLFMREGKIAVMHNRFGDNRYEYRTITVEAGVVTDVLELMDPATNRVTDRSVKTTNAMPALAADSELYILIDGDTASSAELLIGALLARGGTLLIGEQTAGKGIGQMVHEMGHGVKLAVTNSKSYSPSGHWVGDGKQSVCNGFCPDIAMRPDHIAPNIRELISHKTRSVR